MTRTASTRLGPVAAVTQAIPRKVAERLQVMRPGMGTNPTLPDDLVEVGYVGGAYDICGWTKVQLHGDTDALLNARTWRFKPAAGTPATSADRRVFPVGVSCEYSGTVAADSPAALDRNVAEALHGYAMWVNRADFPEPDGDELYWVDLIGVTVVNERQETLDTAGDLVNNSVYQALRVVSEGRVERLVPFVEVYAKSVDVAGERIVVDWGPDY